MRKRIAIGLTIFAIFFLLGGIYIIYTIQEATSTLDNLVKLHQIEILREHLLIHIKRTQADLNLKNTRYSRGIDTIVKDVTAMKHAAEGCFNCHHSEAVMRDLSDLRYDIEEYKDSLSRVFTIRANTSRLETEEDNAFIKGEQIIKKVNNMISIATARLEKKTESTVRKINNTKAVLYVLVIISPLLTAGLALVFLRGLTRPVSELLHATRRLESGDLDYRITGLKDEFKEVAASFNDMAGALKSHMHEMQRTEQMVVYGEMAAGLAHEIKNPLAGIKVIMEVLAEDITFKEEDRKLLLKVIEEVKRIELLMNGLLNFAKPPVPQFASVDIHNIIDTALTFSVNHKSFLNGSKKIHVLKDFDRSIPRVPADPMQLQQVFLNLLLNAADSMPDGGTLTIRTFYYPNEYIAKISISDSGKGIDINMLNKLFHPFFTTKSKGTGLGLAITKRLVEQHGGTISAENNAEGGATFSVCMSVKQAEAIQTSNSHALSEAADADKGNA